jgi:hypothetical protein
MVQHPSYQQVLQLQTSYVYTNFSIPHDDRFPSGVCSTNNTVATRDPTYTHTWIALMHLLFPNPGTQVGRTYTY